MTYASTLKAIITSKQNIATFLAIGTGIALGFVIYLNTGHTLGWPQLPNMQANFDITNMELKHFVVHGWG